MSNNVPPVSRYMSSELITLGPDMEINKAMHVLLDKNVSGAPVLNAHGLLVGMLTKRDCLKAALEASYYREWGGVVESYMTSPVETIDAGLDILAATNKFITHPYRRFPVMDGGNLVGQISRTDALRAVSELWN